MAELFWVFLIYSFLGFLLEVLFARLTRNPKRDRKCRCLLPICPVYGLGAVLILLLPPAVRASPPLLFPAAAALCTAAEFATGLFYRRAARVDFWDYSQLPLNLDGLVCLPFSLAWGGLALAVNYAGHPLVAPLAAAIPAAVTPPAVLFFLADGALTLVLLRRERSTGVLRWYDRLRRRRVRQQ